MPAYTHRAPASGDVISGVSDVIGVSNVIVERISGTISDVIVAGLVTS